MPIRVNRYSTTQFVLIGAPSPIPIFRMPLLAAATIIRGQALFASSGEAVTGTAFAETFLGISASAVDNTDDGEYAEIISPLYHLKWQVFVNAQLVVTTHVGNIYDLATNGTLDLADGDPNSFGFRIEEIDLSSQAAAVNAYGFAIGHFETTAT